jgi:hypothetical protein
MKVPATTRSLLKSLGADFAAFRARSRPHARIPKGLRQAVLTALDAGIEPTVVTKVLGLSSSQIKVWRRGSQPSNVESNTGGQLRVLNVIPETAGTGISPGLRVSYENGRLLLEISL